MKYLAVATRDFVRIITMGPLVVQPDEVVDPGHTTELPTKKGETFIFRTKKARLQFLAAVNKENPGSVKEVALRLSVTTEQFLTPNCNCRFGAPLGRPSHNEYTVNADARPFLLARVRLDRGGYDRGGAYWGIDQPLYGYVGPITDIIGYLRADSRVDAKEKIRNIYPLAKFFR